MQNDILGSALLSTDYKYKLRCSLGKRATLAEKPRGLSAIVFWIQICCWSFNVSVTTTMCEYRLALLQLY